MERLVIASVLLIVAVAVAIAVRRGRPEPPTQARWTLPAQLDRADFDHPDRPWLAVVFTSATCESCARATAKAGVLASPEVAYQEVSYQEQRDLHAKYGVDVVPAILFADGDGVVRASFVGVPTATDLWAALAEVRDPGSTPEPDLGQR
ncbi:MAG TPA: thioredoxin family protein [Acidimicrobiales bacterium]|nr:thioredoxin family protein [Acidimicrobiales bacterium]